MLENLLEEEGLARLSESGVENSGWVRESDHVIEQVEMFQNDASSLYRAE